MKIFSFLIILFFAFGCGQFDFKPGSKQLSASLQDTTIVDTVGRTSPKPTTNPTPKQEPAVIQKSTHSTNCGCSKYKKSECEIRSTCTWIKGVGCRCN